MWTENDVISYLQVYASVAHEAHWDSVRRWHLRDRRSRTIKAQNTSPDAIADKIMSIQPVFLVHVARPHLKGAWMQESYRCWRV